MKDLLREHQLITGLIIEAEKLGFTYTLEILIGELRKIDAQIAECVARMGKKVKFI